MKTDTDYNLEQLIEDDDSTPDAVGDTLVALSTLSIITDDLYSILGDDESVLTPDEQHAVLASFETIAEMHERVNPDFEFPSEDDYDQDDDGEVDDVDESIDEAMIVDMEGQECKSCGKGKYVGNGDPVKCNKCGAKSPRFVKEIPLIKTRAGKRILSLNKKAKMQEETEVDESIKDLKLVDLTGKDCKKCKTGKYAGKGDTVKCNKCGDTAWRLYRQLPGSQNKMREETVLEQKEEPIYNILADLTKLGFKALPQPKDFGKKGAPTVQFGIPMRAGKFADSYFNIYFGEKQAFEVAISGEPPTKHNDYSKALYDLKSRMDLVESNSDPVVLKWNTADEYMFEMTQTDSTKLGSIIENILPDTDYIIDTADFFVFEDAESRDAALETVLEYSKNINELALQTIDLGNVSEAIDEVKFKRLAQTGLVAKEDVTKVVFAMKQLEDGKKLTPAQKDLISATFVSLIELVTGDTSVFAKIKGAI
jgi:hypothetical protein